jgi:omega-amidase
MREITIATVQMSPKLYEVSENLLRMGEVVEQMCMQQRVDLIVFPELVTTGFECGVRFTDLAETVPGHSVNIMSQLAGEFNTHIIFGLALKEKVESILYDAAVLIGPDGEFIGDYRKVHLHGEERMAFRSGFRYPVFETSLGSIGLMLGWDLAFPEVARSLALDGAEIVALSAAWERAYPEEWRALTTARAFENSVFLAAASRVGQEPSYTFLGHSAILGPRGEVYTTMDDVEEGYTLTTIDLDNVRRMREEHQLFQIREPATYRPLVRKY